MQTPLPDPPALEVRGLTRHYASGEEVLTVLAGIDFSLRAGERLAIVGPSGSGKSTLLGLCAGLDQASAGSVRIRGTDLSSLDEDGRAAFRAAHVGFVFQNFQLIPSLSALENVAIPMELRGLSGSGEAARALLHTVGLGARANHYPVQLSGGEQQRVALARAFINRPKLLFADEPTGNLDGTNGAHIIQLLFDLNQAQGTTLVLVTHDPALAAHCDRVITLQDGRMKSDSSAV